MVEFAPLLSVELLRSFLFHLTQGKMLFICLSIGEAKLRSI